MHDTHMRIRHTHVHQTHMCISGTHINKMRHATHRIDDPHDTHMCDTSDLCESRPCVMCRMSDTHGNEGMSDTHMNEMRNATHRVIRHTMCKRDAETHNVSNISMRT